MAANRPVVLVFQEYATLSTSPATPELNCLIAGPCYCIKDYTGASSADKALLRAGTYGTVNAANPYTGPTAVPIAAPPALMANSTLDVASVRVYLENLRIQIAKNNAGGFTGTGTTTAGGYTLSVGAGNFVTAGVQAGDYVILTDADSSSVMRVQTVAATLLTFTALIPASITPGTNIQWRVTRAVADMELPTAFVTTTAGQTNFTVAANGTVTIGGTTYPVESADLFVAHRSLRTDLAQVRDINGVTDIVSKLGLIDARNPLAVGAFVAAQNTPTTVQTYAIKTNDDAGYTECRDTISARRDVYAVVPLTTSKTTLQMFGTSFQNYADPDYAVTNGTPQKFRVVIGSGTLPTTLTIGAADSTTGARDGSNLQMLTDLSATFLDSGVKAGDRIEVCASSAYVTLTGTFTVATVLNNNQLTVSDVSLAATLPHYRVQRTAEKSDQVTQLVATAASFANRRIILCWPDSVTVSSLKDGSLPWIDASTASPAAAQPGYFLSCALGGLTAALPSHQGFTNFGVAGIDLLAHSNTYFSEPQLTQISNSGWFVFAQEAPAALPYVLHQLTTDPSTLEWGEFSMVKNMDFVSLFFSDILDEFIGKWNINDETIGFVRAAVQTGINNLKLRKRPRIGAPIIGAKITSLAPNAGSADRLECYIETDFPKPLNTVGLHIVSV